MVQRDLPQLGPPPRRELLAICGGGFAGLFAAETLARLEEELGRPLHEVFDLMAGTSIGGLLALGLAHGVAAKRMSDLLAEVGPDLFGYPGLGLFKPKHDRAVLQRKLEEMFGSATLAQLGVRVLVPTVDVTTAEAVVLRNSSSMSLVEAALATSAAPTFLAPFAKDERLYADGGLVANSPEALVAIESHHRLHWDRDVTHMLVVGATQAPAGAPGHLIGLEWGAALWLRRMRLMAVAMKGQMSLARQTAQTLLQGRMTVIDATLSAEEQKVVGLDKATYKAAKTLRTLAAGRFDAFRLAEAAVVQQLRDHRKAG